MSHEARVSKLIAKLKRVDQTKQTKETWILSLSLSLSLSLFSSTSSWLQQAFS